MVKYGWILLTSCTLAFGANVPTESYQAWMDFMADKDTMNVSLVCYGDKYLIKASDNKTYCVFPSFECLREARAVEIENGEPVASQPVNPVVYSYRLKIVCEESSCGDMGKCWPAAVSDNIATELTQKVSVNPVNGRIISKTKPNGRVTWENSGSQMKQKEGTAK